MNIVHALRIRYILLALAALILVPAQVGAHPAANYYGKMWWQGGDLAVDYKFTAGFPKGAWRDRIADGARAWNNLNQAMFFLQLGEVPDFNSDVCPAAHQNNGIHWQNIDNRGGVLGEVKQCKHAGSNVMHSGQLVIDSSEDWYTGVGDANDGFLNDCIPSCQTDAWSIASHEMGHMTGWSGHFPAGDAICANTNSQRTMCPSYEPGSERIRSLQDHDIHTFSARY